MFRVFKNLIFLLFYDELSVPAPKFLVPWCCIRRRAWEKKISLALLLLPHQSILLLQSLFFCPCLKENVNGRKKERTRRKFFEGYRKKNHSPCITKGMCFLKALPSVCTSLSFQCHCLFLLPKSESESPFKETRPLFPSTEKKSQSTAGVVMYYLTNTINLKG